MTQNTLLPVGREEARVLTRTLFTGRWNLQLQRRFPKSQHESSVIPLPHVMVVFSHSWYFGRGPKGVPMQLRDSTTSRRPSSTSSEPPRALSVNKDQVPASTFWLVFYARLSFRMQSFLPFRSENSKVNSIYVKFNVVYLMINRFSLCHVNHRTSYS